METLVTHIAFADARQIAVGTLEHVLPVLKKRFDADPNDPFLVFEIETGQQVDFDLRGTLGDVLARELPAPHKGPGRPKLGVESKEVSLLPRHWDWLEAQPNGISAALRRLVEHAMKNESGADRAKRIRGALHRFMTAMAGDRPNYEEAARSLFQGDDDRFEELTKRWPKDVRGYVVERARAASELAKR